MHKANKKIVCYNNKQIYLSAEYLSQGKAANETVFYAPCAAKVRYI